MNEYKTIPITVTFIIRDISPMVFLQESPLHRTVKIDLTEEQCSLLKLRKTGVNCGNNVFEEIGQCFVENKQEGENEKV